GTPKHLHPLQEAMCQNGAIQCGYCIPGMVLSAKALLDRNPNPSEADVRDAIAGNLCRCTAYVKPVEAILQAARVLREQGERPAPPAYAADEAAYAYPREVHEIMPAGPSGHGNGHADGQP